MINECKINITAHAGCMNTRMDSIESVEAGIKYGADIIEIDLNINEDSNLVLSHDTPNEGIEYPLFEIVLDRIKQHKNILLNIDMKNTVPLRWLKNILLEHKVLDKVFLTGLTKEDVIKNKEFLKEIYYFVNIGISDLKNIEIDELIRELEDLKVLGINVSYRLVTKELITKCKERKILTSVWTVDEVEDMKEMIDLKVNSITTKKVDVLKNKISEIEIGNNRVRLHG